MIASGDGWKYRRASATCLILAVVLAIAAAIAGSIGLRLAPGLLMIGVFAMLGMGMGLRVAGNPDNRHPRADGKGEGDSDEID